MFFVVTDVHRAPALTWRAGNQPHPPELGWRCDRRQALSGDISIGVKDKTAAVMAGCRMKEGTAWAGPAPARTPAASDVLSTHARSGSSRVLSPSMPGGRAAAPPASFAQVTATASTQPPRHE